MALNKGKCNYITMNYNAKIRFRNGDLLNCVNKDIYLGWEITKEANPKAVVEARIAFATQTVQKLPSAKPNNKKIAVKNMNQN